MKSAFQILIFILLVFPGICSYAQEEESAEVYLEEYTDEFQELFFEALKQKGIENYDKAINLFLECRQMDPESPVLDHELAKVYLAEKEYPSAEEYGVKALQAEPQNFWYLNTLVTVLHPQGKTVEGLREVLPFENKILKENLASIYYQRRDYRAALNILEELSESEFKEEMSARIRDSINQIKTQATQPKVVEEEKPFDPLSEYREEFNELFDRQDYSTLETKASEALELYPSQPYFYYILGRAMVQNNKLGEAARVLESALDFLIDDVELANDIYRELGGVYRSLGDPTKANMYLSKIKNGS